MLVSKYHDENCKGKEVLVAINKAVRLILQLRSKKELIEDFIETINTSTDVNGEWQKFIKEQQEADIQELIQREKIKLEETKNLMEMPLEMVFKNDWNICG